MPKVIYIQHNGTEHVVEAEPGRSLMQIAVDNMVPGILGDCGGACSCATCHVYVDPTAVEKLPPRTEDETFMLDGALDVEDNSRLSCQLKMREEWDGLRLKLPASQI